MPNQSLQRQAILARPACRQPETRGLNWRRFFASRKRPFAVPDKLRVYAVGDIHGCHVELRILLNAIERDACDAQVPCSLVYLGDYIDRGPASKQVVQRVLETSLRFHTICLRGNHDQTLLDFLDDPIILRHWRDIGGHETLLSYGVNPPRFDDERIFVQTRDSLWRALPADHLEFFRKLHLSAKIGDYFFVHAGIRPGTALEEQLPEDMLWTRDPFLNSTEDFGVMIVHGHTPSEQPVCHANRMCLDTGAYATGRLTAAVFEGTGFRFLHT